MICQGGLPHGEVRLVTLYGRMRYVPLPRYFQFVVARRGPLDKVFQARCQIPQAVAFATLGNRLRMGIETESN